MRQPDLHRAFAFLMSLLLISGCFSAGTYTIDRTDFELAVTRSPAERQRTAVPARSSVTGEPVWLTAESLHNATVLSSAGTRLAVEARGREYATPIGAGLLALGLPLVARGSMLLRDHRDDNAAWLLGGDGPGAWLGVGIVATLTGVTLITLGRALTWQEVKPRQRGWSYLSQQ